MSDNYARVAGVGTAAIFKGDPRLPKQQMDEWYQWVMAEVKGARQRPHLYGSDAGFCSRRNTLLAYNEEVASEVTAVSKAYMAIGVAYENALAEALAKKDRLIAQGVRLPLLPEVKIAGVLDLLIFDAEDELAIVEVKTCGKLPDAPKPQHLAQAQVYSATTGIRKVWLSYFSRNVQIVYGEGLSVRTFPVDTSDETLTGRVATALVSQGAIAKKRLPPVPATFRKHTECHVCEFRDFFCWEPRPGTKGAALQTPPFGSLSTEEYINLTKGVEGIAKGIVSNCSLRKMYFLKDLYLSYPEDSSLYQRVEDEYMKSIADTL